MKEFEEIIKVDVDEHCGISLNNTMAFRALCIDAWDDFKEQINQQQLDYISSCGYVNCTMQFRCVGISKIDFLL